MLLNRDKLSRVRDNLTARQRDLIDALPLLFSVNHPTLPGFVSTETPIGVCDYAPNTATLRTVSRISNSFNYERHAQKHHRRAIKGLYLMGSPGTIGYSKSSDFDIWLIHDPQLKDSALAELKSKAQRIESFAASLKLEMHFFIFDARRFRRGETLSLSDESSGSSQHYLLLDEFYRSGLLLAGLKPLWWCVPPSDEHRYEDYIAEESQRKNIVTEDYVDFGGLANVPAAEFFGAAVWQLYKSIDSPYKSVLKLLLMETYAADFPNGQLLSHRYKATIVGGKVSLNDIDPYILMYRKVEEYLTSMKDFERLELMRRSFYIKANVQLSSNLGSRVPTWQRQILQDMALAWNWSAADIRHLDNRRNWKIQFASKERRVLIKALRHSYAALSKFARGHGRDQNIAQRDFNILGRKLYAAFERKPSKLDITTRGICPDPAESDLSLHAITKSGTQPQWMLYSGYVNSELAHEHQPLMRARSPAEILAWCHFNQLVDSGTTWRIYDARQFLTGADVRNALEAINDCFPDGQVKSGGAATLDSVPRPLQAQLMINVGIDPLEGKVQDGGVLTSNRTDAFQFGGQCINLIATVDLVMMTSWEEIFVFHFEGESALIDALMEYLQLTTPLGSFRPPTINVCCQSKDYGRAIIKRVESYTASLLQCMCSSDGDIDRQFVVQVGRRFYRAYTENNKPRYEIHRSLTTLLKALARPRVTFSELKFDDACRDVGILNCIYDKNRAERIQFFVLERNGAAEIYVLDEYGALFTHQQEYYSLEMIFAHFHEFLQNLKKYDMPNSEFSDPIFGQETIDLYRLRRTANDKFHAVKRPIMLRQNAKFLSLGVFVGLDGSGNQQFTIFCGDEQFSSIEYGGKLFIAIAAFIFNHRRNFETYPIFITDLELSNRFKAVHAIDNQQTIHLLNYKKRIEQKLTRALRDNLPNTVSSAATG